MASIFDLVSDSADGVFGVDDDQRIVFWNRAAERILDLQGKDVLGRPCYEVLCGRNGDRRLRCRPDCATFRLAQDGRNVSARDLRVRLSGGRDVWLSVSTILVPSRWHHLSVLIHLFREISWQKEIERSVMTLLHQLERFADEPEPRDDNTANVSPTVGTLSNREREVLELLASGASTDDVADGLSISPHTVRNHVHHILGKLGVRTRTEAVAVGLRSGLIPKHT